MRSYLIKWYPVYPWDDYQIVDLDILKPEFDSENKGIGFKNVRERVRQLYNAYQAAVERHGLNKYGFVGYNNSWWSVIEAENAILANDIFKQKLEQDWNDHEERRSNETK